MIVDHQCRHCIHFRVGRGLPRCEAFPEGIPDAIWSLDHDHREPFAGDGGTRWEARDGIDPEEVTFARPANPPGALLSL